MGAGNRLDTASSVQTDFEPSRKRGELQGQEHSILRSGDQRGAVSKTSMCELVLLPWTLLMLMLLCFLQAGTYGFFGVLVVIPVVLIGLNLLFLRYNVTRKNNNEIILGLLCLTALLIGLCVALWAQFGALTEYHRLSQGASYFNVLPAEPAAGKSDATTIVFTSDTVIDTNSSFGFTETSAWASSVYCVAPVSDGDLYEKRVEYWAVGINCCESRSKFACFEPKASGAHAAIVAPANWQRSESFAAAVSGAAAAHGLTVGEKSLLLRWTEDPVGYRNRLWRNTVKLFAVFGAVYLVISLMIGLSLFPVLSGKKR